MKFGKVHDIEQIDFSLPLSPFSNKLFMKEKESSFFLGCPVWAEKVLLVKFILGDVDHKII
jgi:hypothetical protein